MENEKPVERRPLDVFDPTEDGYEPHTLDQVLGAGQDLLAAFDKFQAALLGCMTPLALYSEERLTRQLRGQVESALDTLSKAKDIVEMDLPLATMSNDEVPFGEGWAFPEAHSNSLSPERVLEVRLRARQVGPEEQTTYRREIEKVPKIPSLIRDHRFMAEREARLAAMTDEERAAAKARREGVTAKRAAARAAQRRAREEAAAGGDSAHSS